MSLCSLPEVAEVICDWASACWILAIWSLARASSRGAAGWRLLQENWSACCGLRQLSSRHRSGRCCTFEGGEGGVGVGVNLGRILLLLLDLVSGSSTPSGLVGGLAALVEGGLQLGRDRRLVSPLARIRGRLRRRGGSRRGGGLQLGDKFNQAAGFLLGVGSGGGQWRAGWRRAGPARWT